MKKKIDFFGTARVKDPLKTVYYIIYLIVDATIFDWTSYEYVQKMIFDLGIV